MIKELFPFPSIIHTVCKSSLDCAQCQEKHCNYFVAFHKRKVNFNLNKFLYGAHEYTPHEKASTIIILNKPFTEWTEMFNDPIIVTAILDRLLHHSVVINIKGNSYRLKEKIEMDGIKMNVPEG